MDIRNICNFMREAESERSRLQILSWWVKNLKLFWESPHHAHSFNFMKYAIHSWAVFAQQIFFKGVEASQNYWIYESKVELK